MDPLSPGSIALLDPVTAAVLVVLRTHGPAFHEELLAAASGLPDGEVQVCVRLLTGVGLVSVRREQGVVLLSLVSEHPV